MNTDFHSLRVADVRPDTDEAVIVQFDVPDALRDAFCFTPGQHLTLRREIDGAEQRRSYSICTGVDDGALRIGVRKVPGGVFSSWINEQLKAGDAIEVMAPQGRFCVPQDRPEKDQERRHYLAIAGGSGITPILSIMKSLLAREPNCSFTLIYGNRFQKSTMFKEELEDLKNRYLTRLALHHVFSREHIDMPLYSGRMTRGKIAEFLRTVIDPRGIDEVFVCGPYEVNDEAEAALLAAGISSDHIHIERFGVPLPATGIPLQLQRRREGDAEQARVVIVRDGLRREIEFRKEDASILDAAAAAGLDMPFSCKSGVCCTCRARLLEGEVRMERNFALEKHEVDAGYVLTCQAHPLTERVVLSFDER
jgi:ring-1,2-phenylacetyl-CoA epoxidase subunit PaaE